MKILYQQKKDKITTVENIFKQYLFSKFYEGD